MNEKIKVILAYVQESLRLLEPEHERRRSVEGIASMAASSNPFEAALSIAIDDFIRMGRRVVKLFGQEDRMQELLATREFMAAYEELQNAQQVETAAPGEGQEAEPPTGEAEEEDSEPSGVQEPAEPGSGPENTEEVTG